MHSIHISDPAYDTARFAAARTGRSVEAFIEEAVQRLAEEEAPLKLTPEQVAIVRQSQQEIKNGKGMTMEQVEQQLAANKAAWLKTHQP